MNAIHILVASIFGLGPVCGVAIAVANKLVAGMIDDELRTRLDKLAGIFVSLALRRLPPDQQDFYRPDWEGVLLAKFYDDTAGLPVFRLLKGLWFGLDLWLGAGGIRRKTRLEQKTAAIKRQTTAEVELDAAWLTQNLEGVITSFNARSSTLEIVPKVVADAVLRGDDGDIKYIQFKARLVQGPS